MSQLRSLKNKKNGLYDEFMWGWPCPTLTKNPPVPLLNMLPDLGNNYIQ